MSEHQATPARPLPTSLEGTVIRIAGPVVGAAGLQQARLYDVVRVGRLGLIGEIIRLSVDAATIQVYEDTTGLQIGEPVRTTGAPLVATLGPGLLGSTYDGLQRPLTLESGHFLRRGIDLPPLDRERRWSFTPTVEAGAAIQSGEMVGFVAETSHLRHKILVPPGGGGRVTAIRAGAWTIDEVVAEIDNGRGTTSLTLTQSWPVREMRPARKRLTPRLPLLTGTRVIDTFFPVAKGGTAIIPGGFGTGKTMTEQSLARWAAADVVVYVGCGERGNEMAEVLEEFPQLEDPRFGSPLMDRTVLIANTSNMPVAAREASVYLGITIAEYYRDMGYDVLLLADSTSRWGEALREISSRLEEMPGEEGYPAYLAARLAEFYERAGRVETAAGPDQAAETGSVTVVGAVSPPGGDFSEPMTQNSLRVVGTFWALDYDLSRRRHYPAINWLNSYTLYHLDDWFNREVAGDWSTLTRQTMEILQEEEELQKIVELVGPDALADEQRAILATARLLREDYLQQNALDEIDRYCTPDKSLHMLRLLLLFHKLTMGALEGGVRLADVLALPLVTQIGRIKEIPNERAPAEIEQLQEKVEAAFQTLQAENRPSTRG